MDIGIESGFLVVEGKAATVGGAVPHSVQMEKAKKQHARNVDLDLGSAIDRARDFVEKRIDGGLENLVFQRPELIVKDGERGDGEDTLMHTAWRNKNAFALGVLAAYGRDLQAPRNRNRDGKFARELCEDRSRDGNET